MTTAQATAEVFWTAFRYLSKKKQEFLYKLLNNREFREDLIDTAIIKQRRREPSRSLDEYLAERKKTRK
ncbi:MAG TPA: hypothetical protein VFF29_03320 [Bacteroidota bacterium]|nr:hypothetical protein [Bacteroidota bacterium]